MRRMVLFVTVAPVAAAMIGAGALPTFAKQAKTKGQGRGVGAAACLAAGEYETIQSAVNNTNCQTIQLVGNSLETVTIGRNVTITGSNVESPPIVGGSPGKTTFTILPGNTVTFEDFHIDGGGSTSVEKGGGIYNQGTLYQCGGTVTENEAPSGTENDISGTPAQQCPTGPPGGSPEGENGVLLAHKGKELCLPKAALEGHLKHGDEVLNEEGCPDPAARKNGHRGAGARGR
jgi:hypothetical protein